MTIVPIPCATCGGAIGGVEGPDVEQVVLCDILPNGTVAGSAIAVYEYNGVTGLPIGAPTFVAPGTNTPYVPVGILQPCDEPCVKCDAQVLCDNTSVPASETVASTMKMLDTVNVAGSDGWNVTAYNTSGVTSIPTGTGCNSGTAPPLPLPYPAFYMADWCAAYIAACPTASPAGSGCSLNPGAALGVTSNAQGVGCAGGSTFDTACARYLVEKSFNTDAACTKIRVTSQRFRADGSAKVLIDGADTGIFGAYNTSSPDGTIVLTVAPGPHTMTIDLRDSGSPTWISGGLTIECLAIVPASTTSVEFIRTTCKTCTGTTVGTPTDTKLDGVTPYVPGPNVTLCGGSSANVPCTVCDTQVLTDNFTDFNGPHCNRFIRTICHNCDGSFASVKDTLLDGSSPYAPQGTVGTGCLDSPNGEAVLCDFGGIGGVVEFVRTFVSDTDGMVVRTVDTRLDTGAPYTVVGPVGICRDTGVRVTSDILCDNNGPFVREFTWDNAGNPVGFADFTMTAANYLAVGPVKVCTDDVAGSSAQFVPFCDGGTDPPTPFLREYIITAGVVTTANLALDGVTPYAPVGPATPGECDEEACGVFNGEICYTVGTTTRRAVVTRDCFTDAVSFYDVETGADIVAPTIVPCASTCCPTVIGSGCATGGRKWTALRDSAGVVTLYNQSTGAVVLAADVVACVDVNAIALPSVAAHHFNAIPGTPWTPAVVPAGRLVSLTYTVLSGTATVNDADGTSVTLIPAGYTGTWAVQDDRETLIPPASITSVGGRVLVLMNVATP